MKRINIFLVGIFFLAVFLRFYQLDSNPPSLTWDEAAWGYNAYALGIDGRDEFGKFLPVNYLESFGDFKPPMYAYLTILPVKVFGLNEFATRFPSALLGTLTVGMTYFLVKELTSPRPSPNRRGSINQAKNIAMVSAFVLAISPWHIMLSRAAFEANVATFFIVTGVWLFLYSLQKKPWILTISAISFVLSMYTFNTARIVVPLLVMGLAGGCWRQLFAMKRQTIVAGLVGLIILLPSIPFLLYPQARLRFEEVNIFSDASIVEQSNKQIENDHNAWWSRIIHNRRVGYSIAFMNHYFDNLNPNFLFIKGDGNPKFSIQTVGQMYIWEIPFLVIGTFLLFKQRKGYWWIIPYWLLIGIIPAATARETPHALRIEAVLPTFQILVSYGLVNAFIILNLKRWVIGIVSIIISLNLAYFLHGYYRHYPYDYSGEWQYGYQQSIAYVSSVEKNYDEVRVKTDLGRPYIYYLFYMKISPEEFRKTASIRRSPFGFVDIDRFGKYRFMENLSKDPTNGKKILYVGGYEEVPENATVLETIHLLNGKPVLKIYTL